MYHMLVIITLIFYTILPNVLIQGDMTHSRTRLCRWRYAGTAMRSSFLYTVCCSNQFEPTCIPEPERLEIGMNLQVASNEASLFPSPRVPFSEPSAKEVRRLHRSLANDMNQARKWHQPGSKMAQTRLEKDTKQARKWHKPGSKMAQTRLESGTNQARKWYKLGSKMVRTRHEKSRNQHEKSFNSFVLGSKLGAQNGSNQGTMEESTLHK